MFDYNEEIEDEIEEKEEFLRDLGYTDAMIMKEMWGIEIMEGVVIPREMKYRGRNRQWKKLKQKDLREDVPF